MATVPFYCFLLASFAVRYSIAIPSIGSAGNNSDWSSTISQHRKQSFMENEINVNKNKSIDLLDKETITDRQQQQRAKRDNTGGVDVKAIQATINNHRTMIEDHRIMIDQIMNNSINISNIQQAVSDHFSNTTPI
ncbi:unnamed protein product [Rotaria sordida]|uniref:Uncharacterized protein n=1 Tax=Rotaria sordida TaxID=392033 RepID=A0A815Y767_9BILA|nr:unnamed protein product [Rotaria sordida]CAF1566792.1 unnamed protein product [Rotaria sordida]